MNAETSGLSSMALGIFDAVPLNSILREPSLHLPVQESTINLADTSVGSWYFSSQGPSTGLIVNTVLKSSTGLC